MEVNPTDGFTEFLLAAVTVILRDVVLQPLNQLIECDTKTRTVAKVFMHRDLGLQLQRMRLG